MPGPRKLLETAMCDDSQAQTHNGSTAQVGEAWRTSGRLLEEESLEGAVEDEKELTRQRGCWLCGGGREDQDRHSRPACTGWG